MTALGVGGRASLPLLIEARESGDVSAPLWVEALGCATPNGCEHRDGVVRWRSGPWCASSSARRCG
ncbi:MAG: hypothetical protein R3A52_01510 [Polyangiales bacterium]